MWELMFHLLWQIRQAFLLFKRTSNQANPQPSPFTWYEAHSRQWMTEEHLGSFVRNQPGCCSCGGVFCPAWCISITLDSTFALNEHKSTFFIYSSCAICDVAVTTGRSIRLHPEAFGSSSTDNAASGLVMKLSSTSNSNSNSGLFPVGLVWLPDLINRSSKYQVIKQTDSQYF